jgi:hypothetical protein
MKERLRWSKNMPFIQHFVAIGYVVQKLMGAQTQAASVLISQNNGICYHFMGFFYGF